MPVMRAPRGVFLPPLPRAPEGPELQRYLERLHRALFETFTTVFDDLQLGHHRRTILPAEPTLGEIEEGQAILVEASGVRKVCYRINNQVFCVQLGVPFTAGGIVTIQDEGIVLPQRNIINFKGPLVTATDDPANLRTNVDILYPDIGYDTIQEESVSLTQRKILRFSGTTVTAVDLSGITRVTVLGPAGTVGQLQWHENATVWGANDGLFYRQLNQKQQLEIGGPLTTPKVRIQFIASANAQNSNATQLTWLHAKTTTPISNRCFAVMVNATDSSGAAVAPTSVTLQFGSSVIAATQTAAVSNGVCNLTIWTLPNSTFTLTDITVTATWPTVMQSLVGGSISFNGVQQTIPAATGGSPSLSTTSATSSTTGATLGAPTIAAPYSMHIGCAAFRDTGGAFTSGPANSSQEGNDTRVTFNTVVPGVVQVSAQYRRTNPTSPHSANLTWQKNPLTAVPIIAASIALVPAETAVHINTPQYPDDAVGIGYVPATRLRLNYEERGHNLWSCGRRLPSDGFIEQMTDYELQPIRRLLVSSGACVGILSAATKRKVNPGTTQIVWKSTNQFSDFGPISSMVAAAWAPATATAATGTSRTDPIFRDSNPPILFDAAYTGTAGNCGPYVTTATWNHTVGTGANRLLCVIVGYGGSGSSNPTIATVTYGGTALTRAIGTVPPMVGWEFSTRMSCELWYMLAPPSGLAAVVVTTTGTTGFSCGSISLYNVKQQAPEATNSAMGNGARDHITIHTVSQNAWIVCGGYNDNDFNEVSGAGVATIVPEDENANAYFGGSVGIGEEHPHTMLAVRGGVSTGLRTVTTDTELMGLYDYHVLVDAASAPVTVWLPPASQTGQIMHIEKVDASSNAVTIAVGRHTTDTIQGSLSVTLTGRYDGRTLFADGKNRTTEATATWYVAGDATNRRTATALDYIVLVTDMVVSVTSTAVPRTLTLPPAARAITGKVYTFKDESGGASTNNITIDGDGAETIDGAATLLISSDYGIARIYSNGTGWFTV